MNPRLEWSEARRQADISAAAELKAELDALKRVERATKQELQAMGPERTLETAATRQRREALRRKRARLLLETEKTMKGITSRRTQRRRVVQGPKSGVGSVVQGGSPGSGKRA